MNEQIALTTLMEILIQNASHIKVSEWEEELFEEDEWIHVICTHMIVHDIEWIVRREGENIVRIQQEIDPYSEYHVKKYKKHIETMAGETGYSVDRLDDIPARKNQITTFKVNKNSI